MSVCDFVSFHWTVLSKINTSIHSRQQIVGELFFFLQTSSTLSIHQLKDKKWYYSFSHFLKLMFPSWGAGSVFNMSWFLYFPLWFCFLVQVRLPDVVINQSVRREMKTGKKEEREGEQKERGMKGSRGMWLTYSSPQ